MTTEINLIDKVYELERHAISLAFADFGTQGFQTKLDELFKKRAALVASIREFANQDTINEARLERRLSPEMSAKLERLRVIKAKIAAEPCPF